MASTPPQPSHEYQPMAWFTWSRLGRLHREESAGTDQLKLAID